MVGEDGCHFLDAIEAPDTPQEVRQWPLLESLRRTWQRHYERTGATGLVAERDAKPCVRCKANRA
jgi:hypothetical protein